MKLMHNAILSQLNEQIWAMRPEMISNIHMILYEYYLSEEPKEERIKRIEERLGRKLENKKRPIHAVETKTRKVAVIPVIGIIGKRMNMFSDISGGVSTELLKKDIQESIDNPDIDAIVLDIESPGGTVDGIRELAEYIYKSREVKPIVSYANGEMASGALYIGAASSKITAFDTAEIGSLGVWVGHSDWSKFYEDMGIKNTIIRSARFKATPNRAEPLTDEVLGYVQGIVDHFCQMFIEDISAYRGVDKKIVEKEWANGKMFPARVAKDMGIIDHIMTLDETIELAAQMAVGNDNYLTREVKSHCGNHSGNFEPTRGDKKSQVKEVVMDRKELQEQYPALYQEVIDLGKAEGKGASDKEASDKIASLQATIAERDGQIKAVTAENQRLDKELIIEKSKAKSEKETAKAETIMAEILAGSTINEKLYPKVKKMVDHTKYLTEAGDFDENAFKEALKAEVKTWHIPGGGGIGVGGGKEDISSSESDDIELGKRLARTVGQIRSDEK